MNAFITTTIKNPTEFIYKLQVSTSSNFASIASSVSKTIEIFNFIKYEVTNLNYNTKYYIRIVTENNTPINDYVGSFTTPPSGAHNFNFAFGSCSRTCPPNCDSENPNPSASNSILYTKLRDKALNNSIQFFIHMGDMHYRDIDENNEELFQIAFNDVFSSPNQNDCWKDLPMYYMWDDHDYGPNDTDKNNPARPAAMAAFNSRVPRPLDSSLTTSAAPFYSFKRGRVRFIVTDVRSERDPKNVLNSEDRRKKIFSDTQRDWFFNELLKVKTNNEIIIWVNTKPWISSIGNTKDDWGGYHAARMEIVNFIKNNNLTNHILIISGDMHALAYDDGTSINNYGDLKVCHAGPLDQTSSIKGGPYLRGPFPASANNWVTQYGIIEIIDDGDCNNISINYKGISVDTEDPYAETIEINESFNLTPCFVNPAVSVFPLPFTECSTEPPETVDKSSNCYRIITTYDDWCCGNTWDSLCQEFYDGVSFFGEEDPGYEFFPTGIPGCPGPTVVSPPPPIVPSISTYNARLDRFNIEWTPGENLTGYNVNIATDLNFNNTIINKNTTSSFGSVTGLNTGTNYFIRVRFLGEDFTGAFSKTAIQTTAPYGYFQLDSWGLEDFVAEGKIIINTGSGEMYAHNATGYFSMTSFETSFSNPSFTGLLNNITGNGIYSTVDQYNQPLKFITTGSGQKAFFNWVDPNPLFPSSPPSSPKYYARNIRIDNIVSGNLAFNYSPHLNKGQFLGPCCLDPLGIIFPTGFQKCLQDSPCLNLNDQSRYDELKTKRIHNVFTALLQPAIYSGDKYLTNGLYNSNQVSGFTNSVMEYIERKIYTDD